MTLDYYILIPLWALLILASAFFSASEAALLSFDWLRLRFLARKGNRNALLLESVLARKDRLISTILVGNTIATSLASSIATAVAITAWGENGIALATGVMSVCLLVVVEIAPKSFSSRNSEGVGLSVAPFFVVLSKLLSPLVTVVNLASNGLLWLIGSKPEAHSRRSLSEEELRAIITDTKSTALVGESKRQMLRGVFQMSRKSAQEVMIPRLRIRSIDISTPPAEAVNEILKSGYTRIPVYGENPDRIMGIVHVRDVLELSTSKKDGGLSGVLRETFFIPESMTLEKLLYEFQRRRTHMAMVVNEYGGLEGLVTLEDVLEEIVGEIRDEHDLEGEQIRFLPGGEALVQGHTAIRDVNYALKLKIPTDVDVTIAGFVTTSLAHLPEPGESFLFGNVRFTVDRTGYNRVLLVKVTPLEKKPGKA